MKARYLLRFSNVECLKNCSLEDGNTSSFRNVVLGKGKVTPKQAYVALRGPGG
jgi:hypothetical protein